MSRCSRLACSATGVTRRHHCPALISWLSCAGEALLSFCSWRHMHVHLEPVLARHAVRPSSTDSPPHLLALTDPAPTVICLSVFAVPAGHGRPALISRLFLHMRGAVLQPYTHCQSLLAPQWLHCSKCTTALPDQLTVLHCSCLLVSLHAVPFGPVKACDDPLPRGALAALP